MISMEARIEALVGLQELDKISKSLQVAINNISNIDEAVIALRRLCDIKQTIDSIMTDCIDKLEY